MAQRSAERCSACGTRGRLSACTASVAKLSPITSEMNRLMKDPAEIDRILGKGADRAEAIARPIVDQVYDILGMVRSRR